ncbi:lipid A core-O-antigen ligase-like enyme [Bradyrhizobium sp. YR681]|nr:lipid A core-O-antigen ligase-like enyme [Bradyrhizobium sp. YR681]
MVQKNFAGAVCALTIFAFVFDARTIKTWVRFAVVLGSLVFLYFTHAKTSYGLLLLGLAAGWLFQNYNPRFRILLVPALAIAGLIAVGLAIGFWSEIVAIFSRPDAFTGRVQIWSVLVAYWKDNWLLGSGYGSFWNIGGNRTPVFHYVKETDWVALVSIGHNGYLDLLAQTGLPGLVLAVIAVVVVPLRNLLSSLDISRSQGALLMSFLAFCVAHNLLETSLMDRDAIIQMYLMFTIALISVVTRRRSVDVSNATNMESSSPPAPLGRPMRRVSS